MGITVSTNPQQVTASVSEDNVTATVSAPPVTATVQAGVGATGAVGAAGASGSSGVVSVSAPLTNSGTGSAAVLALSVGSGLDVSAGSLVVSAVPLASLAQGGATAGQVVRWNGTAWAAGNVMAGSTAWDDITGKPTFATVATTGSYADLTNKPSIPSAYSLPVATSSVLGGVKQGTNVTIGVDGTISVSAPVTSLPYSSITGTPSLAAVATSGSYNDLSDKPAAYSLPTATASVLGGVKIGSGISIDGNGVISSASSYTLPTATGSVLGGVKIGGGVTITDGVISVSTSYAATSHSHGNISTDGLVNGNTASGQIVVTTSGGALTTAASISSSQISDLAAGANAAARMYLWQTFR